MRYPRQHCAPRNKAHRPRRRRRRPDAPRQEWRRPIARKPPADPAAPRRRAATPRAGSAGAGGPPATIRKKAVISGPRAKSRKVAATPPELDRLQAVIVGSLEDDKGENIVTLDLAGKASFADRMIIATGLADRQISAMATHLQEKLREGGFGRVRIEGEGGSDWVLIDAGDIVVHLFKPDSRDLYALEKMWGADLDDAT
jgi:ribosome-associated protein